MPKTYIKSSPNFKETKWQDLPEWISLVLKKLPKIEYKNFVTIRKLKELNKKEGINRNILGIRRKISGKETFRIKFPINLDSIDYVKLYALMVSEGSYRTEFSLNVPEKELHELFRDSIKKILSKEISDSIKYDYNHEFLRARAPAILRYIFPIPNKIPKLIIKNKEFAREYLKVAFECEGSPILNKKQHKRYIKLSRYTDITKFVSNEKIPLMKRIYIGKVKKEYPLLFEQASKNPPDTLLGEQILLEKHFNIDSKLQLEAIRKNKVDNRAGKITARWVLFIYANNIDKFIREIAFISERKNQILEEMKKIKGNNPQYFALKIMQKVSKNKIFRAKEFNKEMKKFGYTSPQKYIWSYNKKGLLRRIKEGHYQIV